MTTRGDRLMDVTDELREVHEAINKMHLEDLDHGTIEQLLEFDGDIQTWHQMFSEWEEHERSEEVQEQ